MAPRGDFTPLRLEHDFRSPAKISDELTLAHRSSPQAGSSSPSVRRREWGTRISSDHISYHSNTLPKWLSNAAELQKFHELQEPLRSFSEPLPTKPNNLDPSFATSRSESIFASRDSDSGHSIGCSNSSTVVVLPTPLCEGSNLIRSHLRGPILLPLPSWPLAASSSPDVDQSNAKRAYLRREAMATVPFRVSGDGRKPGRYENRNPMSTIQCRNGPHCRKYLEGTCNYNHDFTSLAPNGLNSAFVPAARLNVESPAFTPKTGSAQLAKVGISPKAASAATFTPRGSGSLTPATHSHAKEPSLEFVQPQQGFQSAAQFQEFVPGQSFLTSPQIETQPQLQQLGGYGDPFLTQQSIAGLDTGQAQLNPYVQQTAALGGQPFFQDASSYKHPLNYHLYASIGPKREKNMAYQRSTADFFIPDDLREDLQRKSEATLQTFANSTLPQHVEHFHSLVALDTNHAKSQVTFGFPSWIYKATSSQDGHTYALRRIEGFSLKTEAAIKTIYAWKRIKNASIVQVVDAFTTGLFEDRSLIVVTDYHPKAQTLGEKYFATGRHAQRPTGQVTSENDLWGYIVQLASALKAIHEANLAAQTVIPSKVLVTSKNRLQLNGCGVFDIIQHEQRRPVHELQGLDLRDLGWLILDIAARSPTAHQNPAKALDFISRSYSERLRSCLAWLVTYPPEQQDFNSVADSTGGRDYSIHTLLTMIADKIVATFDSALHQEDELTSNLMRELENGRLVRLLAKLNVILERPELSSAPGATTNPALINQPSSAWSETGERYYLKLFRDYVFHQIDHDGRPVLDLGHIITCLNKLDAGIDEKIQLVSRDEQNVFITSYKDVKRGFESAWAEIGKASNPARR